VDQGSPRVVFMLKLLSARQGIELLPTYCFLFKGQKAEQSRKCNAKAAVKPEQWIPRFAR